MQNSADYQELTEWAASAKERIDWIIDLIPKDPYIITMWILAFVILIGGYIFIIKANRQIDKKYGFDAKVEKAKSKGNCVMGTRLRYTWADDWDGKYRRHYKTYHGTYSYEVDGIQYEKRIKFRRNSDVPPVQMPLYWDKSPKKVFSPNQYRSNYLLGFPIIIWTFLPFISAALFLLATGAVRP